jgi:hypothetical protein
VTLSQFLQTVQPASSRLDLIHCTSVARGVDALIQDVLRPSACDVYGEDLLYLFYGRPAFKPLNGIAPGAIQELWPICLVLDPGLLDAAVRILPFDSGGFERYRDVLGPHLTRQDFELEGDPTAPLRLVGAFYRTSRNYYTQAPAAAERDFAISQSAARGFARLIVDPTLRDDDDRRSTIEVQFRRSVRLSDALKAVVAPSLMFDDPAVLEALRAAPSATPIAYPTYGRATPLAFANTLYEKVDDFFTASGAFT